MHMKDLEPPARGLQEEEEEEWYSCVGKDIASEERSERSYAKPIVRDKPCASSRPEDKNPYLEPCFEPATLGSGSL